MTSFIHTDNKQKKTSRLNQQKNNKIQQHQNRIKKKK